MKATLSLRRFSQSGVKRIHQATILAMAMAVITISAGGAMVDVGTAGNYAILAKSTITTTTGTSIVGDIGLSPAAESYITGFDLTLDSSGEFSTSDMVTGKVFAADLADPTPANLTTAVGDMETAYTDAAGRPDPDHTNLADGDLNGQTLTSGLYKWGTDVTITDSVTISGDSSDVWIFQIDNRLNLANDAEIFLDGGARAENIFWQTAEGATLGTTSHFEGILLTATDIAVKTNASVNGHLYAQTAVTLESNDIVQVIPEPSSLLLLGLAGLLLMKRRRA